MDEATRTRLIQRAKGCLDYLGGYTGADLAVFHHGIETVIRALEATPDTQTAALEAMGGSADPPAAYPQPPVRESTEVLRLRLAQIVSDHHAYSEWRHKRTGKVYRIVTVAYNVADELAMVVVYRQRGGVPFCRPMPEFLEKFEKVEVKDERSS
jgi:hypothetical protein